MSRTIRGLIFGCMGCAGMALSMGWADTPVKKSASPNPSSSVPATKLVPRQKVVTEMVRVPVDETADSPFTPAVPPRTEPGAAARIVFESNWKNVQVGSKPLYFHQGEKPFIWTVKNTGDTPVDVGDDYGFSIAPGAEEFIVDVRLVLSVDVDKTSTVEVKASRVMTQNELTGPSVPTPATPTAPIYNQFPSSYGPTS